MISQMFDLSFHILRLIEGAKNFNEVEEKIVKLVFEIGRHLLQTVLACLDWRLMKERDPGLCIVGTRESIEGVTSNLNKEMIEEFYRLREIDTQGRPSRKVLEELGLGEVADALHISGGG